jgi:beta-lactamase class A
MGAIARSSRARTLLLSAGFAGALLGSSLMPATAPAAAAARAAATVTCASSSQPKLAADLASDIRDARRGRASTVALWVSDPVDGLTCSLSGSAHFDSASVVKVIILGALLRRAEDKHRYLPKTETTECHAMITRSDNNAASALWAELGYPYLRHFLALAGMKQTSLGADGYWGLTQITAHDETLLLQLLLTANSVLDASSRAYALHLMATVIPSQRWGVPAGAPTSVTVHVKNGWLPLATHGWRIHSIGAFTWPKGWYTIVVLTQDNPTMAYGVTTIERIARAVNHDLNPTAKSVIPQSTANPSWGIPDERIPSLPSAP